MSSLPLVAQLQRDALDRSVPVSDLLRKAKVVAVKLDLPEFLKWVDQELNGYDGEVPEYRTVDGQPKAFNPYRGWIPIVCQDPREQRVISKRAVCSSIAELEHVCRGNGKLHMPFSAEMLHRMNKNANISFGEMTLFVDQSLVKGILDAARNTVLEWSLKLEKAGIMGEEFSFSPQEKERAHTHSVNINIGSIGNMAGSIGPVTSGSTINVQQSNGLDLHKARHLIDQIEKALPIAELGSEGESQARELVAGVRAELSQSQPDQGKLRGMFGMLKKIAEGAASKIVADGITSNIDSVFPS